jgi:hypothetical protein
MVSIFPASLRFAAAAALVLALLVPAPVSAQGRPMIEHIEPTSGPPGTRVQIVGRGFRPRLRVLFAEQEIPVLERLPERVTVEVPANARSGRFVVAHGNDEVESEVFRVTAAMPAPRVTLVDPASAAPGSEVVLRGENFGPRPSENNVRIGTLPMVVRSAEPTMLRVIVPEGAVSGPITVRTSGGEAQTPPVTIAARVVVREFVPAATTPGGQVILRGHGFGTGTPPARVTIGGRTARVVSVSPTEMVIEVPRDALAGGAIVVDVPGAGRFETGSALRVAPAPFIAAVEPPQGAGNSRVVLRGERFGTDASAVRVMLGETPAAVLAVGPREIVTQVPAGASSGRWNVTVAGIGPVQSPADFQVLEPVSISSYAPAAGDVGDRVTLSGTGFSTVLEQNTVRLGSTPARVVGASAGQLVVEVPAGAHSGQWIVAVAGNGEARHRQPFMVTLRPRITALEPDRGIVGERVVLRGENFPVDRALLQVRLGDIDCTVESLARDAITVTVPRGLQAGAARFSVIGRLQGSGQSPMEYFVLVPSRITAVEPAAAPPGARVIVRGEGFESDPRQLRLRLGAQVIRPLTVSTTAIEFVVPRNAQSGEVVVEGAMRQPATAAFRVSVPPVVQTVAPAQGAPGTRVTIRGRNFGSDPTAISVFLGEVPCPVMAFSPTSVTVEVPPAPSGRFVVRVRDQGDAAAARDFRITTARPARR